MIVIVLSVIVMIIFIIVIGRKKKIIIISVGVGIRVDRTSRLHFTVLFKGKNLLPGSNSDSIDSSPASRILHFALLHSRLVDLLENIL